MQCVILAGGLGTRISSVVSHVPKALIPVAGRPFAFHQLDWLADEGVKDVVYCIGHRGEMIRDAVGDGARWGMRIRFSEDGETLLGTGGAIRKALHTGLAADRFLVLYADSYLPIRLAPVWERSSQGRDPTMVVMENRGLWDKSNVIFADGRITLYDKNAAQPLPEAMTFIDYGVSAFNDDVFTRFADVSPLDLSLVYNSLSKSGELLGWEVHERFYEIGSPTGLHELEELMAGTDAFVSNPS